MKNSMATSRDNREQAGCPEISERHPKEIFSPEGKKNVRDEKRGPLPSCPGANDPLSGSCFVTFRVGERCLALPLGQVDRVLRMVQLISVPEAPDVIQGLINLHGEIMPAVSLRARLGLPMRPVHVDDRILVIKNRGRRMGLVVESVEAVVEVTADQVEKPEGSLVKAPLLRALIRKEEDIYLVLSADHIDPEVLKTRDKKNHETSARK